MHKQIPGVKNILLFIGIFFFLSIVTIKAVYAATTVMTLSPTNGTYPVNVPFSVSIVINGNGDRFNAAQATVTLSSNLSIQSLFLEDCNFAFINTPTILNPSFVGVLLGTSSTHCTLYTMSLYPSSAGSATITLSNAKVKQYGNGSDVLIGLQNGNFTILPPPGNGNNNVTNTPIPNATATPFPSPTPTPAPPDSVTLQVVSSNNTPVAGATVVLNPPQPTFIPAAYIPQRTNPLQPTTPVNAISPAVLTAITDSRGVVQFTHVPKGLHKIVVEKGDQQLGQNLIMVTGKDPIALGIKAQEPKNFKIIIIVAVGLILLFTTISLLLRYTPLYSMIKNKYEGITGKTLDSEQQKPL